MKRILFLILVFAAGRYVVRQLMQEEQRDRLARLPATMMERCMEMMPEDSPPVVMMSSLRRMQEQNEELVTLMRELNERFQVLLREQNDLLRERLPAQQP